MEYIVVREKEISQNQNTLLVDSQIGKDNKLRKEKILGNQQFLTECHSGRLSDIMLHLFEELPPGLLY